MDLDLDADTDVVFKDPAMNNIWLTGTPKGSSLIGVTKTGLPLKVRYNLNLNCSN